jgi:predicted acetyltransferase
MQPGDARRAGINLVSLEIDVLNGDASWPAAKPLLDAVWPAATLASRPWGHIRWAHADLRVLVEADERLVSHVGVFFRMAVWNGRRMHIGGVGGVATFPESQRHGYASVGLRAAIQILRDREDVQFALLFCEPRNIAFYQARGWHSFAGEIHCEQPDGRIRFEALAPMVFEIKRRPRDGVIDLCGLPW